MDECCVAEDHNVERKIVECVEQTDDEFLEVGRAEKRQISLVLDGIALSTGVIMSLRYLLSLHEKEGERKKAWRNLRQQK